MDKWKIIEIILSAAAALISAAKAIIKFIEYLIDLNKKKKECAAA